jgi:hypothetical protein
MHCMLSLCAILYILTLHWYPADLTARMGQDLSSAHRQKPNSREQTAELREPTVQSRQQITGDGTPRLVKRVSAMNYRQHTTHAIGTAATCVYMRSVFVCLCVRVCVCVCVCVSVCVCVCVCV